MYWAKHPPIPLPNLKCLKNKLWALLPHRFCSGLEQNLVRLSLQQFSLFICRFLFQTPWNQQLPVCDSNSVSCLPPPNISTLRVYVNQTRNVIVWTVALRLKEEPEWFWRVCVCLWASYLLFVKDTVVLQEAQTQAWLRHLLYYYYYYYYYYLAIIRHIYMQMFINMHCPYSSK